jgi:hypothetical protein
MNYLDNLNFKHQFLGFTLACVLSSCSIITVLGVDSPSADCAGSGQHFCHDTTITRSLWNGRNNKRDITSGCSNGISRVKVTTKPGDVLIGFFTVGFVVKQRLDWDCSQRSGASDIPH